MSVAKEAGVCWTCDGLPKPNNLQRAAQCSVHRRELIRTLMQPLTRPSDQEIERRLIAQKGSIPPSGG